MKKQTAAKNHYLIYPTQEDKVVKIANNRSKKENRIVSRSEVVRDAIDEAYDNEFRV